MILCIIINYVTKFPKSCKCLIAHYPATFYMTSITFSIHEEISLSFSYTNLAIFKVTTFIECSPRNDGLYGYIIIIRMSPNLQKAPYFGSNTS